MNLKTEQISKYSWLIVLSLVVPIFILWKNAVPVFQYFLFPTEKATIKIQDKIINGKRYLILPVMKNYQFSRVELNVKLKQKTAESFLIEAFSGYEATLLPVGEEIDSAEQLAKYLLAENGKSPKSGLLVADEEAVYFLSNGMLRTFVSPRVFEKLGFDWGKIVPLDQLNGVEFPRGESVDYMSPHPEGTLIELEGKIYLIWNGSRLPLKDRSLVEKVLPAANVVRIDGIKHNGNCQVALGTVDFDCQFNPQEVMSGKNYFFAVPTDWNFENADVTLDTSVRLSGFNIIKSNFLLSVKERFLRKQID